MSLELSRDCPYPCGEHRGYATGCLIIAAVHVPEILACPGVHRAIRCETGEATSVRGFAPRPEEAQRGYIAMLGAAAMKQAPVLNEREKQRMLQHLQRTSYAARNRCMLQLSWLAGMRVGEIAALLRNKDYERYCKTKRGAFAELYADWGDVVQYANDFKAWFNDGDRGRRLFAEPLLEIDNHRTI